jgi:hypothetical protein
MKKQILLVLVLAALLGGGVFAQNNWISTEVSIIGGGLRYERVINPYLTLGANFYINTLPMFGEHITYGGSVSARWYPTGRKFFLELDFGGMGNSRDTEVEVETFDNSGISTGYDWEDVNVSQGGFTITPGLGWTIDVGKAGGFFWSPGVKFPLIFTEETTAFTDQNEEVTIPGTVVPSVVLFLGFGFSF